MSVDKEKHHCRAIIMDDKNRSNYTIDMQADESGHAEYHEDEKEHNIKTTVSATGTIDNLNKVLLYKSNDDTKCELAMFRNKDKLVAFKNSYANGRPEINNTNKLGIYYTFWSDKFDKNGGWYDLVPNNILQSRGDNRKLEYLDNFYLRVVK
jgi:hypothetical protein